MQVTMIALVALGILILQTVEQNDIQLNTNESENMKSTGGAPRRRLSVTTETVSALEPDTMATRLGEPTRYDLPWSWRDHVGGSWQKKGDGPIITDLGDQGTLLTDDSETGYKLRKILLDKHNALRAQDAPQADYMNKLLWDFHIEAYAEQWAKALCTNADPTITEHSPDMIDDLEEWP
eukprot:Blabericola_migrator_1__10967@NODE_634_length_7135_cov_65_670770_g465_i0_p3_GENE_NODE_634_length_7135_cov_65_670770_g465_i0NODE_634_length_7135_cov_65_670770_g465_i0_p3_ORF_typecomplete_len179_score44_51CAP/PF00188_26/0_00048SNN_transmemb/PF09049_10/1_8SNN_transmemb/PF09049_10/8_7e02_NODE_634_length_7135_cov_65_670770_g465_i015672103